MLMLFMLLTTLMVLIGVVFVTLFERKILGLIQFRLGPNKVYLKGLFQSFSDAIKLISKSNLMMFFSDLIEYNFMPLGMMFLMLMLWMMMPSVMIDYNNNLLIMLCLFSLGVYPIMIGSWFSGSVYSMLGSIRSIAQMISYEVSMIIIMVSVFFFPKSFNLMSMCEGDYSIMFMLLIIFVFMLFVSLLFELGRTPADLYEGESELVSGFNTEYLGLKFALIFLSEYGMIMFMSGLVSSLGLMMNFFSVEWSMFTLLFITLMIWIRGIMPRIRYDKLMYMCWVSMLNLSLGLLCINSGFILVI